MGSRFSGARTQDEEDEGEDDEDEEDSRVVTHSQAKKVAHANNTPAVSSKSFAELAAEAAAKKKRAPAVVQNSAGAEFARLAAAKKAAAKAPKKAARAPAPDAAEKQVLQEIEEHGLPRGGEGATWIALEDSPVREDRDIKSAKKGVIQKDESCQQTGPWRADPSGRVRMPVRGARCFGWVTVDATKCRGSDGSWGSRAFELLTEAPAEEDLQEDDPSPAVEAATDDIDDLLEMFGTDEAPCDQGLSNDVDELVGLYGGADVSSKEASKQRASAKPRPSGGEKDLAASEDCGFDVVEEKGERATDLTPAQKRLRNVKKRLRDLEGLEAKLDSLTDSQRARLERKQELLDEEKAAAAEVKKELNAGKKKRPKPKKVAATTGSKSSAGASSAASARGYLMWFALLPVVALSISYVLLNHGAART